MAAHIEQVIKEIKHQKQCSRQDAIDILDGVILLDTRGQVKNGKTYHPYVFKVPPTSD